MAKYLVTKSLIRATGESWETGDTVDISDDVAARYPDRLEPVPLPAPARRGKGDD